MSASHPNWLETAIGAVREVMLRRLEGHSLDVEAEKDLQMAVEELDVMWEELQGRAELLERENARYAEFFEHSPDAYVITDAGGNVREANRAALELLGVERLQLVGRPLSERIATEERVAFLSRFVGTILDVEAGSRSWPSKVQPAHGAPLEVRLSMRAMPLRKSAVRGLCWLIRPL